MTGTGTAFPSMRARKQLITGLLLCLVRVSCLAATESRISLSSAGQDLSSMLAIYATLGQGSYATDPAVHTRFLERQPLIILHEADARAAHQALAHGLRCWWVYSRGDDVLFSDQRHLPPLGPARSQVFPSALNDAIDLEALVQRVLDPWYNQPGCGLISYEVGGRWMASFDASGLAACKLVLAALEHAPDRLPPARVPHPETSGLHLRSALQAPDQTALWQALARQCRLNLSVHPDVLSQPGPRELPPTHRELLPLALQELGLQAAWYEGVLCVDRVPIRRREHPALRLRIARIPLAQFGDPNAIAALALRLQDRCGGDRWQDPGHTCYPIPGASALLLAAAPDLFDQVLAQIAAWDSQAPAWMP